MRFNYTCDTEICTIICVIMYITVEKVGLLFSVCTDARKRTRLTIKNASMKKTH